MTCHGSLRGGIARGVMALFLPRWHPAELGSQFYTSSSLSPWIGSFSLHPAGQPLPNPAAAPFPFRVKQVHPPFYRWADWETL